MMSKGKILEILNQPFEWPASEKSGEYLADEVSKKAVQFQSTDRRGLVEALRDWIKEKSEPRTMMAVDLVGQLDLKELEAEVETLKQEISSKEIFPKWYVRRIDAALSRLKK